MVSAWWLPIMFVIGICCGFVIVALLAANGDDPEEDETDDY